MKYTENFHNGWIYVNFKLIFVYIVLIIYWLYAIPNYAFNIMFKANVNKDILQ